MKPSEIKATIYGLKNKAMEIDNDKTLSELGRNQRKDALRRDAENVFKPTALGSLEAEWADVRRRYKQVMKKQAEAVEKEAAGWDYQRLSYEFARLSRGAGRIEDVKQLAREVESGDKHTRRAFYEVMANEALSGNPEILAIKVQAARNLQALRTSPDMAAIVGEKMELIKQVNELNEATTAAHEYFNPGGRDHWIKGQSEFEKMAAGVRIDRHYNGAGFELELTIEE